MSGDFYRDCSRDNLRLNAKTLPWALILFIAAMLFILEDDFRRSIEIGQEGFARTKAVALATEEGSVKRKIALFSLGFIGIFYSLIIKRKSFKLDNIMSWLIVLYLIIVFTSVLWSYDMALTLRRVIALSLFLISALAVAKRLYFKQFIYFALICTIIYLFLGIISEFILGTFSPLDSAYRFHGTIDRNAGALRNVILFLAILAILSKRNKFNKIYIMMAIISGVFIILSKTRAAVAAGTIVLFVWWLISRSNLKKIWRLVSLFVISSCFMILLFSDTYFRAVKYAVFLGRLDDAQNATLTGRVPVWSICLDFLKKEPVLGYGYNSFWTPDHIIYISKRSGWGGTGVSVSLNGYLDIALGLGIIGVLIFVLIMVLALKEFYKLYIRTKQSAYLFSFSVVLFFCLTMILDTPNSNLGFFNFLVWSLLARLAFFRPTPLIRNDITILSL